MRFGYRIHHNGDHQTFSVFDSQGEYNTNLYVQGSENFDVVKSLIEAGDDEAVIASIKNSKDYFLEQRKLFAEAVSGGEYSLSGAVAEKFTAYLDASRSEDEKKALGAFFTRLSKNPNVHSQDNLFSWLSSAGNSMRITDDGMIIGYRGLTADFKSRHAGFAVVNGEVNQAGPVDNAVGNVIEMPRHMVNHNPSVGCSFGLHVGTNDYAAQWGGSYGVVVVVTVDPADVVSVPSDCNFAKMRVCKYSVVAEVGEFDQTTYEYTAAEKED